MKRCMSISLLLFIGLFITISKYAIADDMEINQFKKEIVPNSITYFSDIRVLKGDDKFIVSGKIRLRNNLRLKSPDFIEVELVDVEGNVIERQKVSHRPQVLTGRRKNREARFAAQFNQAPPSGSIIRLSNIN